MMDSAIPTDHRVKKNESERINKYLYLTRELKKVGNIGVTVIIIIVSAQGTVRKIWKKRLATLEIRRIETI